VKMRFALLHPENNFHDWIQGIDFLQFEVSTGIKSQTIRSGREVLAFREQLWTTTILIGMRRGQRTPVSGAVLFLQTYRNLCGRLATNEVQNVSRNAFHPWSHFLNLISVICRCCSAAS